MDDLSSILASGDRRARDELNVWIEKYSHLYLMEDKEENEGKLSLYCHFLREKHLSLVTIREIIDSFGEKSSLGDYEVLELFQIKAMNFGKLKLHFSEDLKG